VTQPPKKNGGTASEEAKKPATGRSNAGGGAGLARVVSMIAAGKRLARTVSSSRRSQPTRSFCYNDNGSMVDLRCQDHASTFQCRAGTLPEDSELVVLHGPEVGVERVSRFQWRRQHEMECWSCYSGDLGGMVRPPTAEQLLSPPDGDDNGFRVWTPTASGDLQSNCRLSDTE